MLLLLLDKEELLFRISTAMPTFARRRGARSAMQYVAFVLRVCQFESCDIDIYALLDEEGLSTR